MNNRVLIVDDAKFMRMMIKNILVNNGFEVIGEAENGDDGVQKYFELKPDIVTLDITMPVKTGIECLREIRSQDPNVKAVMCSAMGQQALVVEAIQAGAKDFIVKPFQKERVIEALRKVAGT